MEHRLEAELTLSAPPADANGFGALLGKVAADAIQRTIGSRGGQGRVADWKLDGVVVTVAIESDGPRPHQALLALVRRLSEELGRAQKIGVRSFRAPRYSTSFSLEAAPEKEVELPLPHRLTYEASRATLELTDLSEPALRDNWMDRAVALVREKLEKQHYEGKGQFWTLLAKSPPREMRFELDPTEEMLKRQWVRSGPTKGKWFLGPTAAHLLRTMERIAREEVLEPLGFREVVQPHHDSFDILLKTGHLAGLPGEFYYVSEPKTRDPVAWERFTDLVKITGEVPTDELARMVTGPTAVSCYAQCPTIYWWLSGRTIATESLPLLVFDRTAISNRYESGGRHGLERVDEFHRIEPVYLGSPDELVALRERLLERYSRVFNDLLELEWRTAWVTPFYMQQSGQIGVDHTKERVTGTVDFEAYLPYRGTRDASEWLEFQNLSILGEKYTKAFSIKSQKGELWSGCSGIGLERWLTAFLAQKGLDPAGWPAGFREYAGTVPHDVHFL
jgi:seryl-tRNA synthetase